MSMKQQDNRKRKAPEEDWSYGDVPEKVSPLQYAICLAGCIVVAVILCSCIWAVTHSGQKTVVIENQEIVNVETSESLGTDQVYDYLAESQEPEETLEEAEEAPVNENLVVTQDGREILFFTCNDYYSPKEYVNLRSEPSTAQGKETVVVTVKQGDRLNRTGYSDETGWSRVLYNDQVVYVVTSYLERIEE